MISNKELTSEILQDHKFNCEFVLAACKWELVPNDNHDWGKRPTHSGETRKHKEVFKTTTVFREDQLVDSCYFDIFLVGKVLQTGQVYSFL